MSYYFYLAYANIYKLSFEEDLIQFVNVLPLMASDQQLFRNCELINGIYYKSDL